MKHQTSEREFPCALRDSIQGRQKRSEKLSPLECRRDFQFWVAYIRPTSPGLSSIEQYTCPLLSCNKTHCDFRSFLAHVATCPQLENAEYWCSTCRRYERFPSVIQRTRSRLKRAAEFFRDISLRRRSSSGLRDTWPMVITPRHSLSNPRVPTDSKFELEAASVASQGPFAGFVMPGEYLHQTPTSGHYELAAVSDDKKDLYFESLTEKNVPQPRFGPNDYAFISMNDSGYNSPVDSMYPSLDTASSQQSLPRTESPRNYSSIPPLLTSDYVTLPELESPARTQSIVHPHCSEVSELGSSNGPPRNASQLSLKSFLQVSQENELQLASDSVLPAHILLTQHYNVCDILLTTWKVELSFTPELAHVLSLPVTEFFKLGLGTWLAFELGKLPTSIDSALAMSLVAVTFAYIQYEDHDTFYWNGFLQELLDWQSALPNTDQRSVLKRAMEDVIGALPSAQSTSASSPVANTGDVLRPHASLPNRLDLVDRTPSVEKTLERGWNSTHLLHRRRAGRLFSAYLQFLDDVGFEEVLGRSLRYQATSSWYIQQHEENIRHMRQCIIEPLSSCSSMTDFQDEIDATDNNIQSGILRSVREVELTLLGLCKRRYRDQVLYDEYRSIITMLCDQNMAVEEAQWRTGHYATEMVILMANDPDSTTNPIELLLSKRLFGAQPSYPSAYLEDSPMEGFPIEPTPMTSYNDLVPAPLSSKRSPTPKRATRECPYCNKPLSISNLARHIKTHRQNGEENLPCLTPSCDMSFARSDLRDRHMREQHDQFVSTKRGSSKRQRCR